MIVAHPAPEENSLDARLAGNVDEQPLLAANGGSWLHPAVL
jgi:hypothetical protein